MGTEDEGMDALSAFKEGWGEKSSNPSQEPRGSN